MKTLLSTSALTSIMFTQMKHPLAMGMMLLIQTTIMCMISSMMDKSAWFSYILFLMFIGGMMVLFIYVTSLASNEMFSLSTKMTLLSLTAMIIPMSMSTWTNTNNKETMTQETILTNETSTLLEKLYNQPTGTMTILMASYLLLTLIVIAKITNISKGPLRQTK
nr:NADH dehydrogenase subunit 6 [Anacanthotermes sp. A MLW-2022a]